MMISKKMMGMLLAVTGLLLVAGCGSEEKVQEQTIKVGVSAGPFEEVAKKVKEVAKEEGIKMEIVPFNDFVTPNRALENGDLDVNVFQTKPYLEQYNENHKANIATVGKVFTTNMAFYSKKYKTIEEIPEGATLGIMNDPLNLWRGLLLYEEAGLIKLKPGLENYATIQDIAENPKKLKFKELEGGMLAPAMNSLDVAIIPSNFAIQNGYDPKEDPLYIEQGDKFPIYLATAEENKDNEDYKKLTELYSSTEVKAFIKEKYDGVFKTVDHPFE